MHESYPEMMSSIVKGSKFTVFQLFKPGFTSASPSESAGTILILKLLWVGWPARKLKLASSWPQACSAQPRMTWNCASSFLHHEADTSASEPYHLPKRDIWVSEHLPLTAGSLNTQKLTSQERTVPLIYTGAWSICGSKCAQNVAVDKAGGRGTAETSVRRFLMLLPHNDTPSVHSVSWPVDNLAGDINATNRRLS